MISEIFPLHLRSPAMALCTVANWAFNFLVSFTFLSLVGALGRTGTFLLYATVGVIALIFFATRVPETKRSQPRGDRTTTPTQAPRQSWWPRGCSGWR
jgi:hypothetical protein